MRTCEQHQIAGAVRPAGQAQALHVPITCRCGFTVVARDQHTADLQCIPVIALRELWFCARLYLTITCTPHHDLPAVRLVDSRV